MSTHTAVACDGCPNPIYDGTRRAVLVFQVETQGGRYVTVHDSDVLGQWHPGCVDSAQAAAAAAALPRRYPKDGAK